MQNFTVQRFWECVYWDIVKTARVMDDTVLDWIENKQTKTDKTGNQQHNFQFVKSLIDFHI